MRTVGTPARGPSARPARAVRTALASVIAFILPTTGSATDGFLDDAQVIETLVEHTLRGQDWIEYYTRTGEIQGKVRYFGVRDYTGRWSVQNGRVCYEYDHPQANTCSFLRRDGDRVSHHLRDGTLKKDGLASRMKGRRLEVF